MSDSNSMWPFQEISAEEGLDINEIFGAGTSSGAAAPEANPFQVPQQAVPAPEAATSHVEQPPTSPTAPQAEQTPAPQPTAVTIPPATIPAAEPVPNNPLEAAFAAKTVENAKASLFEKKPVFCHKSAKEVIEDPTMTFEELRIRKSEDFLDLEEGKNVSWSVEYGSIRKDVKDPKGTTIISMKESIERSREFLDALKKAKDKNPDCIVRPKVTMKNKGTAAYKGTFPTVEAARNSDMQNAFRTSIKQIVEAGQAERAKLEELQVLEKKARDTFLQFQKDDIAKLEETLQEAKEAAEPDATRPEAQQLQERMQALAAELEFGAFSQEEYDRMFACREELQQVRADIAAIEKATPASGDLDSQLKAARAEIDQCKLKLQYLAQYISKRAEMTFSALKMNRVEISLYDVVKSTGEVKDAFKFTYNGRRYDWLSLSEKIRAGMEVSELMKRLTGRNYPQFVDNMESVDDLANVRPTGQVIMAKCVSKAELSVRPVKPILTAMPTAA